MNCLKEKSYYGFKNRAFNGLLKGINAPSSFFISTLVQQRPNRIEKLHLDNVMWTNTWEAIGLTLMNKFRDVYCEDSMP